VGLRRQRNWRDARDQLGSAYKIFDSAGAARPTDLEDALERLRALAGGTLAAGIGAPIARFRMVSAGLDLG
jgi:hypothetical protein